MSHIFLFSPFLLFFFLLLRLFFGPVHTRQPNITKPESLTPILITSTQIKPTKIPTNQNTFTSPSLFIMPQEKIRKKRPPGPLLPSSPHPQNTTEKINGCHLRTSANLHFSLNISKNKNSKRLTSSVSTHISLSSILLRNHHTLQEEANRREKNRCGKFTKEEQNPEKTKQRQGATKNLE